MCLGVCRLATSTCYLFRVGASAIYTVQRDAWRRMWCTHIGVLIGVQPISLYRRGKYPLRSCGPLIPRHGLRCERRNLWRDSLDPDGGNDSPGPTHNEATPAPHRRQFRVISEHCSAPSVPSPINPCEVIRAVASTVPHGGTRSASLRHGLPDVQHPIHLERNELSTRAVYVHCITGQWRSAPWPTALSGTEHRTRRLLCSTLYASTVHAVSSKAARLHRVQAIQC
jgi:hypothetical protein